MYSRRDPSKVPCSSDRKISPKLTTFESPTLTPWICASHHVEAYECQRWVQQSSNLLALSPKLLLSEEITGWEIFQLTVKTWHDKLNVARDLAENLRLREETAAWLTIWFSGESTVVNSLVQGPTRCRSGRTCGSSSARTRSGSGHATTDSFPSPVPWRKRSRHIPTLLHGCFCLMRRPYLHGRLHPR